MFEIYKSFGTEVYEAICEGLAEEASIFNEYYDEYSFKVEASEAEEEFCEF